MNNIDTIASIVFLVGGWFFLWKFFRIPKSGLIIYGFMWVMVPDFAFSIGVFVATLGLVMHIISKTFPIYKGAE